MAEFQEVMKQKGRMCNSMGCTDYALNRRQTQIDYDCDEFIICYPDKAERIIMEWGKEHPIMTNAEKLKEVFGIKEFVQKIPGCEYIACPTNQNNCDECKYKGFWDKEYQEPKKV